MRSKTQGLIFIAIMLVSGCMCDQPFREYPEPETDQNYAIYLDDLPNPSYVDT